MSLNNKQDDSTQTSQGQQPAQLAPIIPGASDDLLAELRAKTAKLAEQVGGKEGPLNRTLELDEDSLDIFAELEEKEPKPAQLGTIQSAKKHVDPAVKLIRDKLARLYKNEPDAVEEAIEAEKAGLHRSRHQQFMYDLTTSGKSLADIQTQWHAYYVALPDSEKHVVWKEFYQVQQHTSEYAKSQAANSSHKSASLSPVAESQQVAQNIPTMEQDDRSVAAIKSQLMDRVSAGGKLKPIHHFKSLLFGVGLASIVGLIITFTFFNEAFIAPFISPSQNVSATPIIGPDSGEVGPESKIIIPKINVEVPVVFDLNSIEEKDIQNSLEDGVVHYATTPNPGETGNAVIVGHSSNNILNSGKYKFAFVLLKRLENEDLFYVQRGGVRYTYKVYKKEIVPPTDVSVLDSQERANTMTLITCDPPGTSINRLIITAEQISPDPATNTASTAPPIEDITGATDGLEALPSNAPSLWSRIWPF
jgi:LPXTG-site transpeptidase (sortase) family protein